MPGDTQTAKGTRKYEEIARGSSEIRAEICMRFMGGDVARSRRISEGLRVLPADNRKYVVGARGRGGDRGVLAELVMILMRYRSQLFQFLVENEKRRSR